MFIPHEPAITVTCPVAWDIVAGYFSTRLLLSSAIQRFPTESNEIPVGLLSVVAVVPAVPVVKVPCPSTRVAASPVVIGAAYFSARLLPSSATQRFPAESNEIPNGFLSVVAVVPDVPVVNEPCPTTRVAASPVVIGVAYFRTRLLLKSTTQRFPAESNEIPIGMLSVVAVVPDVPVVKVPCPTTTVAASPVVIGAAYFSTRLLPPSTTHRFPAESIAEVLGPKSVVEVVPGAAIVKVLCPTTTVAACPFENAKTLLAGKTRIAKTNIVIILDLISQPNASCCLLIYITIFFPVLKIRDYTSITRFYH